MADLWYEGRTSRFFAGSEAVAYGTAIALAGSNAMRILKAGLSMDPHAYRLSPQRFTDPSQRALLLGRFKSSYQVDGLLYPSGVLNTLPEQDCFLSNLMGAAATNITLATTVSSGGATTGAVVASAAGLAVGQLVQLTRAGVIYVRRLTVVAGATLTWAPALPTVITNGEAVKGMISYKLGTTPPYSIDMASYPHAPSVNTPARELLGGVVDKGSFTLDGLSEPKFAFSGMAKVFAGSAPNYTPQAEPGSWVTVGAEASIPTGMIATLSVWDGAVLTVYSVTKIEVGVENAMDVQNVALGSASAVAFLRKGKRKVTIKVGAMVSDNLTLWTPSLSADASTTRELLLQIGNTSGYIWAMSFPSCVVMAPPTIPDADETQSWDFMLTALSTSGNDEAIIGQA